MLNGCWRQKAAVNDGEIRYKFDLLKIVSYSINYKYDVTV